MENTTEIESQINGLRNLREVMIKTRKKVLADMSASRISISSGVPGVPLIPSYEAFKSEYLTRMKQALLSQGITVELDDIIDPTDSTDYGNHVGTR